MELFISSCKSFIILYILSARWSGLNDEFHLQSEDFALMTGHLCWSELRVDCVKVEVSVRVK